MKAFEFPDITSADIAFIAYGKDLNEMFANSGLAMSEVMVDTSQVSQDECREIRVSGIDMKSLMFNFLNAVLVIVDSEGIVFSRFDVDVNEAGISLSARCFGQKVSGEMETRTEVKAATYHQMSIEKDAGLWKARVILDI